LTTDKVIQRHWAQVASKRSDHGARLVQLRLRLVVFSLRTQLFDQRNPNAPQHWLKVVIGYDSRAGHGCPLQRHQTSAPVPHIQETCRKQLDSFRHFRQSDGTDPLLDAMKARYGLK
jgi:hypothetical protein